MSENELSYGTTKSRVCIDLGASNTRHATIKDGTKCMPNNVTIIEEDLVTLLDKRGSNDSDKNVDALEEYILQNLDVTITSSDIVDSEYFPVRALVGDASSRYRRPSEKPNALKNKHKQVINYINAITSLAIRTKLKGLECEDIYLYLALPPIEAREANDYVEKQLKGHIDVKFNMLDFTVKLNIVGVTCLEESYMALTSFFFTTDGKAREEAKQYANDNVLFIDIGASTTDLAAAKAKKYLEKSGRTIKIGGNVVRDNVANAIQELFGFEPDLAISENAVAEGRVQLGKSYKDISEKVVLAKEEFAQQITNSLDTYFTRIGMPLQSFVAIIVGGGGSMQSSYIDESVTAEDGTEVVKVTSAPMSEYITKRLKAICADIDVIQVDNPRLANLNGMLVRAKYDEMSELKKQRLAEASVAQVENN